MDKTHSFFMEDFEINKKGNKGAGGFASEIQIQATVWTPKKEK